MPVVDELEFGPCTSPDVWFVTGRDDDGDDDEDDDDPPFAADLLLFELLQTRTSQIDLIFT